jgi:hypothetical protein
VAKKTSKSAGAKSMPAKAKAKTKAAKGPQKDIKPASAKKEAPKPAAAAQPAQPKPAVAAQTAQPEPTKPEVGKPEAAKPKAPVIPQRPVPPHQKFLDKGGKSQMAGKGRIFRHQGR